MCAENVLSMTRCEGLSGCSASLWRILTTLGVAKNRGLVLFEFPAKPAEKMHRVCSDCPSRLSDFAQEIVEEVIEVFGGIDAGVSSLSLALPS